MGKRRETSGDANLDRRRFLGKAAVAGGTVWAVPTLVSMRPAGASELTSAPPAPPTTDSAVSPNNVSRNAPAAGAAPATGAAPSAASPALDGNDPAGSSDSLARTGADIDKLAMTGLTAVAAGGALTYWSAGRMHTLAPAVDGATPGSTSAGPDITSSPT